CPLRAGCGLLPAPSQPELSPGGVARLSDPRDWPLGRAPAWVPRPCRRSTSSAAGRPRRAWSRRALSPVLCSRYGGFLLCHVLGGSTLALRLLVCDRAASRLRYRGGE